MRSKLFIILGSGHNKCTRRQDPPCVGVGGYARYHLSGKPNGQNILALKFVETFLLGLHEACLAGEMVQGGLNLFLSFYS